MSTEHQTAKRAWAEEARYIKPSQRQWWSDILAMQIYSEGRPDEGEGDMVSIEEVKEREPIPFLKRPSNDPPDADVASSTTAPEAGLQTHSRLKEALESKDVSLLDDQLKFQLRVRSSRWVVANFSWSVWVLPGAASVWTRRSPCTA